MATFDSCKFNDLNAFVEGSQDRSYSISLQPHLVYLFYIALYIVLTFFALWV